MVVAVHGTGRTESEALHTLFNILDTIMTLVSPMISVVVIVRFLMMSDPTWTVIHLRTPRIVIAISMISLSFHPLI